MTPFRARSDNPLGLPLWAVLLALGSPAAAADLHVPGDFGTLQAAADAAVEGDRILVGPGSWGCVYILGKSVSLVSLAGPDQTILGGCPSGGAIYINDPVGPILIEGFEIRDASSNGCGGGIRITPAQSGVVIRGNRFIGNVAVVGGGICYVRSRSVSAASAPLLVEENVFIGNSAEAGGALNVAYADGAIVSNNRFIGNTADYDNFFSLGKGGAISADTTEDLRIENNLFVGNLAAHTFQAGAGGALYLFYSCSAEFIGCTFVDNLAEGFGNLIGLETQWSTVSLTHCLVVGSGATPFFHASSSPLVACSYSTFDVLPTAGISFGPGIELGAPDFVPGPGGAHYLSQVASGQPFDSLGVDLGNAALPPPAGSTRSDGLPDQGIADLGFHYPTTAHPFRRGDCNREGVVDIADAIHLLGALFATGGGISCEDACDGNDDGQVNIADAISVLSHLFVGGSAAPPPPFPDCGTDPSADGLPCLSPGGGC